MTSDPLRQRLAPHRVPPLSSIAAVSRQTGITQVTLRLWQARYGLGPALTTPDGRYTKGDVQRLRRVMHLVSEGLTTTEAVDAVLSAAGSDLGLPSDADPMAHHLGAAALELDSPTARRIVDEHLRRGDVVATWEALLRPVLSAIGNRWSNISYGITVERLLSHVVVALLNERSYAEAEATAASDAHGVVLACVPGELHELPLAVLDAALHAAGIGSTRLLAPTSEAELAEAVSRHRRPVVALHAITSAPTDPAYFDLFPAGSTLLALGPGWRPDRLPRRVLHINTLGGARERIRSLVTARTGVPSTGPVTSRG